MFRRNLLILVCCLLGSLTLNSLGMAKKSLVPTMLVVPAHYSQLQVAFDIANRYDALLVSYQSSKSTQDPLLHVWNGEKWIQIRMEEYRSASFLTLRPETVVLIGEEHLMPRSLVVASDAWGSSVLHIASSNTADILNSLGKLYNFRSRDWRWFAARYNLDIEDLNADVRSTSWYDRSPATINSSKKIAKAPRPQVEASMDKGVTATTEPVAAPESMKRASIQTSSDIVIDDLPSVSGAQQQVSESTTLSPPASKESGFPSGWKERAVATDIPVK